jgi:drug/metabolite transporter (DMT)-like permease
MNKITVMLLTFAAFSAACGQLLFRVGARGRVHWLEFINLPLLAGLLFYIAGTIVWIYALSKESIVNVYAFTALTFVLVYLGGVFLMSEHLSPAGFAGIMLVLCGLYLITNYNV